VLDDLDCNVAFASASRQENNRIALNAYIDYGLLIGASDKLVGLPE
jgi:hypothetical protein